MTYQTFGCAPSNASCLVDLWRIARGWAALSALILVGVVAACSPSPSSRVDWSLQDDASAFREEFAGSAAMAHRIGELEDALTSDTYARFIEQVESAPPASRALIYYEAASSVSHYYFALALEGDSGCRVYVSDQRGTHELSCSGVDEVAVAPDDDVRLILDPGVAVLVQFSPNRAEPRRSMRLLNDTTNLPDADALFARVQRTFS